MRAWLFLLFFLSGCGMETTPMAAAAGSAGSTGAGSTGSTGSSGSVWPKQVTLVREAIATQSDDVQLADGAILAGDGDLNLDQAMVLSLSSPTPESLCEKGKFPTLADIPTGVDTCPGSSLGSWQKRVYLSAASLHTSEELYVIGLGLLVRNKEHTALYRLRVVGDSYDAQGVSTATFEYEPVP